MKIVLAPNAFKGSLSATKAAHAMLAGIRRVSETIEVGICPLADGGDGLTEVLTEALGGDILEAEVAGPLGDPVKASFGCVKDRPAGRNGRDTVGIVEMAQASGLVLVPQALRNPGQASTFGTGQLIKCCLDLGVHRLLLGLGGSATCDGGLGVAQALGYRFLDRWGNELAPIGDNMVRVAAIDSHGRDGRLDGVLVEAACDVSNPLTGIDGASYVYSPQKGADPEQVHRLDEGLANLAAVIKKDLGADVVALPGGGAAGGLGAGVVAFLGGRLRKGIDLVIDSVGLAELLAGADLVITGEGRLDYQTVFDKAPAGAARAALHAGVPCVAIAGSLGERIADLHEIGIDAMFSLCNAPLAVERAMEEAEKLLATTTEQVVRLFLAASSHHLKKL